MFHRFTRILYFQWIVYLPRSVPEAGAQAVSSRLAFNGNRIISLCEKSTRNEIASEGSCNQPVLNAFVVVVIGLSEMLSLPNLRLLYSL